MIKRLAYFSLALCVAMVFVELALRFLSFFSISLEDKYIQKNLWGHIRTASPQTETFRTNTEYVFDSTFGYIKSDFENNIERTVHDDTIDYRIVILGDSISDYGSYPSLLQEKLSEAFPNKNIRIINGGIVGYETTREALLLKKYMSLMKPDLVIIQTCMNDFFSTPVIFMKGATWTAIDGKYQNRFINAFLFNHFKTYRLFTLIHLSTLSGMENFDAFEGTEKQKSVILEPLQTMIHMLNTNGVEYRIVVFPIFNDSKEATMTHDAMMQIIKETNSVGNTVDLLPIYQTHTLQSLEDQQYPGHPNEKGHTLAADALFKSIAPLLQEVFENDR